MKRLIVCCDGTWNSEDDCDGQQTEEQQEACKATNIWRIAGLIAPRDERGIAQRVFYQPGVGTDPTRGKINRTLSRLGGGAFGWGLDANILEAYRWLVREFDIGDQIWLFGFSRGAYTARSLGGLIRNCGLLRREYEDQIDRAMALYRSRGFDGRPDAPQSRSFRMRYAHEDQTRIEFIGVWDTVGSRGLPSALGPIASLWNKRYQFHDCVLSSTVNRAYHALAVDEVRKTFEPALWTWDMQKQPNRAVQQVWFAGVHSDIGGGYTDRGLANIALRWMIDMAKQSDDESTRLAFKDAAVAAIKGNALGELHDSRWPIQKIIPGLTRPRTVCGTKFNEKVHHSVRERMMDDHADYNPRNVPADAEWTAANAEGGSTLLEPNGSEPLVSA